MSYACFAFVGDDLSEMGGLLRRAFTHPWVVSYQVGFGPPLVRCTAALVSRLTTVRSSLEKLDAYLETCVYDDAQRALLAKKHRHVLTRRYGPVEAETVREASAEVLDLTLRLYHPSSAPRSVREDMALCGAIGEDVPSELTPDAQEARFWVHLSDPRNARLLHAEELARVVTDPDRAMALELWVPAPLRPLFKCWGRALARDAQVQVLDLGAPRSVARVSRDGQRL